MAGVPGMGGRARKSVLAALVLLALAATLTVMPAASNPPDPNRPVIELTAEGSADATFTWEIDKTADVSEVTVGQGQQFTVNYTITVTPTQTSSGWSANGEVVVYNKELVDQTVNAVTVDVSGAGAATVTCASPIPHLLPSGAQLKCTWTKVLPDNANRTATATATLGSTDYSTSAAVDFTNPADGRIDKCVDVYDSNRGFLDQICVNKVNKTITYTETFGPFEECGDRTIENMAWFVTNHTGTTGEDTWVVEVNYPCPAACEIGDFVWIDANGDGVQNDGAASGENGVRVELLDQFGNVVATTMTADHPVTGAPGWYSFEVECNVLYGVRVSSSNFTPGGPLEDKLATTPNAAADDVDSDGDPFTNTSPLVSVPAGADTTIDFGYICPVTICPPDGGFGGNLYTQVLPGGDIKVTFNQFKDFNDNSYGLGSVGWGGTDKHLFKSLTGSDKAGFKFSNAAGDVVLEFQIDYLTCKDDIATPSKCASLGFAGGDGGFKKGNQAHVLSWNTSLAKNLNDLGFCAAGSCVVAGVDLKVDSPPTLGPNDYTLPMGSPFTGWDFQNSYEVVVSKDAFGASGFGSVSTAELHNSPSKKNASCPSVPGVLCADGTKIGSLTMQYTGQSCAATNNPQEGKVVCSGDPAGAGPVRIVVSSKDGKKTYYDSNPGGGATLAVGDQFTADAINGGKSTLESDTLVRIYDANGTLLQSVQFHTSCSKPIAVGNQFGSLLLLGGVSVPK